MITTLEQTAGPDPLEDARQSLISTLKNCPPKKEGAEFLVSEKEAAEEIGLTRETYRDLRERLLIEGTDWVREKNRVLLTREAAAAVAEAAGVMTFPEEKKGGAAVQAQGRVLEILVVHSVPRRNVRMLDARKKEGGALVRVRVRDNRNFVPGMELRAYPEGTWADVYVMEGRCPRYRGRW